MHIFPRAVFACSQEKLASPRLGAWSDGVRDRRRLTSVGSELQIRPHWDPAVDVILPSRPKKDATRC